MQAAAVTLRRQLHRLDEASQDALHDALAMLRPEPGAFLNRLTAALDVLEHALDDATAPRGAGAGRATSRACGWYSRSERGARGLGRRHRRACGRRRRGPALNGRQERTVSSAWRTEAEALEALAARQKAIGAGVVERVDRTLGEAAHEHLAYKANHGKRGLKDDERILRTRLLPAFGAGLPIRRVTAAAIAQYEKARMATPAQGRGRKASAYTVANELSVLRHLLRLAKRWGYSTPCPKSCFRRCPKGGCATSTRRRSGGCSRPAARRVIAACPP